MEGSEDTDLLRMVDLGCWFFLLLKKLKKGKKCQLKTDLCSIVSTKCSHLLHQDPANRGDCQKEQQLLLLARLYLVLE